MSGKKQRVVVAFGGRSGEHEISCISAASVMRNLDRTRFEVVPLAIDKQGVWRAPPLESLDLQARSLVISTSAPQVVLPPHPVADGSALVRLDDGTRIPFDAVFPVMHGPMCEDGTIQGLLELAEVAYVGCGVLASSVGMDKEVAKRVARDAGLPIVPFVSVKKPEWTRRAREIAERVASELGYPVFVKPANMGSSLGVHKVKTADALAAAMTDAFQYDLKVLIERGIDAREIEFAVLENAIYGEPCLVSTAGEINPRHEFYSYEAKYFDDNGAELLIPSRLKPDELAKGQALARATFEALECEGLSRVDLFLDRKTGAFYLNEINTLPGFTHISMYPKMWEASGIPYASLLTRLVELALARQGRKQVLLKEKGRVPTKL